VNESGVHASVAFEHWRFDSGRLQLFHQNDDAGWSGTPIGQRAGRILARLLKRPGEVVSKDQLMEAGWPGIVVEPNNLSVQITTLRRTLDQGRTGSCIQTVPGKGYRFIAPVVPMGDEPHAATLTSATCTREDDCAPAAKPVARRMPWVAGAIGICATLLIGGIALIRGDAWFGERPPPRMSLAVLPFETFDGGADDRLADAITSDLVGELSQVPDARVTRVREDPLHRAPSQDIRDLRRKLDVRYAVEGGVQQSGGSVSVNAQLVSLETGTTLWADRFDVANGSPALTQDIVATRIRDALSARILEIEAARGQRERPDNPDVMDLLQQGRVILQQPFTPETGQQALTLFEHALALDPSSIEAMAWVGYQLTDTKRGPSGWRNFNDMERAGRLLTQAHAAAPHSLSVLNDLVYWLRTVGRCPEVMELARRALQLDPVRARTQTGIANELGFCSTWSGDARADIALQKETDRRNPRSQYRYIRYLHIGMAAVLLGDDAEAIDYLDRSLALNARALDVQGSVYRALAVALARSGRMEDSKHALAQADERWKFDTVRRYSPDGSSSSVYMDQIRTFQAGLRLAGERDHADEAEDFGIASRAALSATLWGYTPMDVPHAKTVNSDELAALLASAHPMVLDTMTNSWGVSIPGAVGLKFAGLGGDFSDAAQSRLKAKMQRLVGDDTGRPIVAVGWNSECYDGRNLALRLAALGYTRIYWYRGGREAWEAADRPEATIDVQDW
jgi:adenylate cyclase